MEKYPIIVIGAGAGGLVIANGAAKAGKKVLLVERGHWGGDCTNFGCVPSKSLIASAHASKAALEGKKLGIEGQAERLSTHKSLERVRGIVSSIRHHEEPEVLEKNGVKTMEGKASFVSPHELDVGGEKVYGETIILACGSSPFIPSMEGIDQVPYLTNETVFDLEQVPKSMIVVGGGPIGCELAQAFGRLGTKISQVHSHKELLGREDPDAQEVIADVFTKEGIDLYLGYRSTKVSYDNGFQLTIHNGEGDLVISAEQLLISTGRRPNVKGLDLEKAGVDYTEQGIPTDLYGRTNVHHIWAVGDVKGPPFFTHLAEHHARGVLTSLIIPIVKKKIVDTQPIPRVTFTDPEVASVGYSEMEAIDKYGANNIAIYKVPFTEVDRAITASREEGFVKIVTKKWSSKILGATIVGERAGEMLSQVTTAMFGNIPLRKLADLIHPYPTYSQAVRKAADLWLKQTVLPTVLSRRS